MSGIPLGARFSLATNRLRYCGPEDAEPLLYRAIVRGRNLSAAGDALRKFEALEPYLAAIADKHGRDPLDRDVVEAYWIGNELLDDFTRRDFVRILERLGRRGLPPAVVRRLKDHLPERPMPHHAFHVTFVGVGAVTGKVETTLVNMERCRPSWGFVVGLGESMLELEKPSLILDRGRFRIGENERTSVGYDPKLMPGIRPGDAVALHWDVPVVSLDASQLARLQAYTQRSLEASSEALAGLRVL